VSALLLDTNVVLWALGEPARLTPPARDALADGVMPAHVSVATIWEAAIKRALGKLQAPDDLPAAIADAGFSQLPITAKHAWGVRNLPLHHRDPFDRLLAAQALDEDLTVVSADPRFDAYGVRRLW
jgi:PIN domain nuclease of toxin-antitoxin system